METLKIERRLIAELNLETNPIRRAELKEELNTLLQIDLDRFKSEEKIEDLTVKLAISENK